MTGSKIGVHENVSIPLSETLADVILKVNPFKLEPRVNVWPVWP